MKLSLQKIAPICFGLLVLACSEPKTDTVFQLLQPSESGIDFRNDLKYDEEFNVYTYRNYYNGGGVSVGDINQDGLVDIYFTSNLNANKLFLNKGNFRFEDITDSAGVAGTRAWSTGVTMADVNGDGLLDIYVCNSGDIKGDNKQNELFINNGDMTFTESAAAFGLADNGYSTHASFFDYDKDGDLDAYILNNSYQAIGSFDLRRNERPKRDLLGGDKLMRNDGGVFVDVSQDAGIYGSIIGFGLGVTVGDVNGDNWDDIYVSNDFFERDYLYINNQDGTFSEQLTDQIRSISAASMGADLADINNDGYNDLFVTEMLPSDHERLKSVTTFEDWTKYEYNIQNGYYHQYTRNTFQLNNGDSTFSEIGRLAGVEASDWSWGALIFDFENDGMKDLFIANGIYQDLTNQDYLQYISNEEVLKSVVTKNNVDYKKLIDIIPSNPIENHAYQNKGNLKFEKRTDHYGLNQPGFSNGSAYGDFDNDGDLDLVVNNVNMQSFVYKNTTAEMGQGHYVKFEFEGNEGNRYAIGAKVSVRQGDETYYVEQQPIRGFQSSVDPRPNLGLKTADPISISVVWPNGQVSVLTDVPVDQTITVNQADAGEMEEVVNARSNGIFKKVDSQIEFVHTENRFVDFNRDRLLYHMNSTEAPKIAVADIDGDGFEDVYVGGSKGFAGAILKGSKAGYNQAGITIFDDDKISEDAESVFFDADGDGDMDLYVCSGGVEFSQSSSALKDRLYFNDGKGGFAKSPQNLPSGNAYVSSSTVSVSDVDGDGDMDLFVGERMKPLNYGEPCAGFLLINDGAGNFVDRTADLAPNFAGLGMITDATFSDIDGDQDEDLIVVGEFMSVTIFENSGGSFVRKTNPKIEALTGWWKSVLAVDIDGDGDQDFVLGNHGLNSRFRASGTEPISLYVSDFDNNGFRDPILTGYAADGKEYPYALRHNLIDQIKSLKKNFPDYESFKQATIDKIFTPEQLDAATKLTATTLASTILINDGNFTFSTIELPVEAQLSPVYGIASGDFDQDGDVDVIMGGNLYGAKPEVGRYDASNGVFVENLGDHQFKAYNGGRGFYVDGEIRDINVFDGNVLVSRNNDSMILFQF
ncbi:MAG: VCBS repeat-containing protein [Cyclobacteriaceae bacterium]